MLLETETLLVPNAFCESFRWSQISKFRTQVFKGHELHTSNFGVLLTVHLSIFISVINQLDAQNFCFTISLFHASICFEQFWPPDDEHMCSKHVETWNKLIVKQKFCAWSWLITEINSYISFAANYTDRRSHITFRNTVNLRFHDLHSVEWFPCTFSCSFWTALPLNSVLSTV